MTTLGALVAGALELRAIRRLRLDQEACRYGAAMPTPHDRTGGHSRMQFLAERQLTLGESIAIARYMRHIAEGEPISVRDMFSTLDRLEVCTTCGWSRQVHEATGDGAQEVGICEQWTRKF